MSWLYPTLLTVRIGLQDTAEKEAALRGQEAALRLQQSDLEHKTRELAEQRDRASQERKVCGPMA